MHTPATRKLILGVAGCAWLAFWFWAFSLAYSDGFFLYNRHARLPTFAAALLCACVIPLSTLRQWHRVGRDQRGALAALLAHGLTSLLALAVPFSLTLLLSRAHRPWRLEADDAMGVGIDNAVLLIMAALSVVILATALAARRYRRRRAIDRSVDQEPGVS